MWQRVNSTLFLNWRDFPTSSKLLFLITHFADVRRSKRFEVTDAVSPCRTNHLDVIRYVLEGLFAVLHGDLVVVLTLGDVSHLRLGLVLQQQDGWRHQHAEDDLQTTTHSCGLMRLNFQNSGIKLMIRRPALQKNAISTRFQCTFLDAKNLYTLTHFK